MVNILIFASLCNKMSGISSFSDVDRTKVNFDNYFTLVLRHSYNLFVVKISFNFM